jgi:hypothetical protein
MYYDYAYSILFDLDGDVPVLLGCEQRYKVTMKEAYVDKCDCPVKDGLCKHIFLVSRMKILPYSKRTIFSTQQSTNNNPTDSIVDEVDAALLLDAKERFSNMKMTLNNKLQALLDKAETPQQIEYGIRLQQQMITEIAKLTDPFLGPTKQ